MAVHLYEHRLSYFPVPKVACTSIKSALFVVENGFEFRPFQTNGEWKHIHNVAYETVEFSKINHSRIRDHTTFALVRDPIQRILSCYSNRVLSHGELREDRITSEWIKKGAKPDPSLNYFVEKLDLYRSASGSIKHHTDSMTVFLGSNPEYFTKIFNIRNIYEFAEACESITNRPLEFSHMQKSNNYFDESDLTLENKKSLREIYSEDYNSFGLYL